MRSNIVIIISLFLFALSVRLFINEQFVTPFQGDEPHLFNYAVNVMNGEYYGTSGAYWPPGYIFFMGFMFKIFGLPETPNIVSVQIIQSLLDAISAVLIFAIARHMFAKRTIGIIASLLYALLPAAVMYTGMFYSETLWIFFMLLGIWLTFVTAERLTWPYYVVTGFVYGLAALVRPTSLPLVVLAGLLFYMHNIEFPLRWDWRRLWSRFVAPLLIMVVTIGVTISPWVIRNIIVIGEPVLFSVNPGINLYLAHNEKATGRWVDMGPDDPVLQWRDHPEVNRQGKAAAYDYILAHPLKTLKQAIHVHKWFWTVENVSIQNDAVPLLKKWYELYSFKLLAVLGLLGIVLARHSWRSVLWIVLFMIAYNGLIDFLYFASRYRYPIEPFLVLFAAVTVYMGGQGLWRGFKHGLVEKE